MRRVLKALIRFIFIAVPMILVIAGTGFVWMARSLPPVSGAATIEGLSGPVTIERDENGVPHISGSTPHDVFAGLGFAHAQDRLWQMEVSRIAAQGRLSEIFGDAAIGSDVWLRSVGLFEAAQAAYENLPEAGKDALKAYAAGVNAWLERDGRFFAAKLPPEFVILRHTPEPWEPVHGIAAIKMMSVMLGANARYEAMRLGFARIGLTSDEINDLLPPSPKDNPPPLPDLGVLLGLDSGPLQIAEKESRQTDAGFRLHETLTMRGASNSWAISGRRTTTGQPIVANDPHLSLSAPSIWYLAHLRVTDDSGARDLVGATFAGAPLVPLGRNHKIAWGFTSADTDVQDIYVERINPNNEDEYLTPDGWQAFGKQTETIKVRGGEDHTFTRRWTRHGPVLPPAYLSVGSYLPQGTVAALRWVALDPDDTTLMSGINLWQSDTVADFKSAMVDFVTPIQVMVIADDAGNIGMIAPGRMPIRDPANQVMGRAPVPGWESVYDWKGWVPFADLPHESNPAAGAIATANTKPVGPDYPYFLTFDWEEAWREERIDMLVVDNPQKQSPEMSRDVQADVESLAFAAIGPEMIRLVEDRPGVDAEIVALLKDWDYRMVRDSAAPLVFMAWVRESTIDIFGDDLGPAFGAWFEARGRVMQNLLAGRTSRQWCDDRSTAGEESCAEILAAALGKAVSDLENRYGTDRDAWNWGEVHLAAGRNTPFNNVPVLRHFFDVQVESQGGPFTLDRGKTQFSNSRTPYMNVHGSSFRGIYDLSDLDKSTYITTTGQSGNPFSRHYRDFAVPWSNVESITIPTDPQVYRADIAGSWQLTPR